MRPRLTATAFVGAFALFIPSAAAAATVTPRAPAPPGGAPTESVRCPLAAATALAVPTALPVGLGIGCPGVRPGALVRTPLGICTLNFMWLGSDGARYMGTAGHCLLGGERGERVFEPGTGPVASEAVPAADGQPREIGRFVYALADDGFDFALIRLDPGVVADPAVCFFGGPTALDSRPGPVAPLSLLSHVGQGRLLLGLLPARTQAVLDSDDSVILGVGLAAPGDSGEPLLGPGGEALGVVVATGPALLGVVGTGIVFSTRLAPQIQRAADATGIAFTLVTAPKI